MIRREPGEDQCSVGQRRAWWVGDLALMVATWAGVGVALVSLGSPAWLTVLLMALAGAGWMFLPAWEAVPALPRWAARGVVVALGLGLGFFAADGTPPSHEELATELDVLTETWISGEVFDGRAAPEAPWEASLLTRDATVRTGSSTSPLETVVTELAADGFTVTVLRPEADGLAEQRAQMEGAGAPGAVWDLRAVRDRTELRVAFDGDDVRVRSHWQPIFETRAVWRPGSSGLIGAGLASSLVWTMAAYSAGVVGAMLAAVSLSQYLRLTRRWRSRAHGGAVPDRSGPPGRRG